MTNDLNRAVFKRVAKVMLCLFGFALLRSLIGQECSHHFLAQSEVKTKTNRDLLARLFSALSANDLYLLQFASGSFCFLFLL